MALLRALFWFGVALVPLFGVWLASSLAAYWNGPVWLVVLAGALLFPVLPVAWDLVARRKKRSAGGDFFDDLKKKKRAGLSLGFGDRLLIRTLVLNTVFLGVVFGLWPTTAYTALSGRGDWVLDGRSDAASEQARTALFTLADALEPLFVETVEDPYEGLAEVDDDDEVFDPQPAPAPEPEGFEIELIEVEDTGSADVTDPEVTDPDPDPDPDPDVTDPDGQKLIGTPYSERTSVAKWPFEPTKHPKVDKVPKRAEASIEELGQWARRNVPDQRERIRFLHDWVADHVAYDFERLDDKTYIHFQDSETVFSQRRGVCAGYANLLVALGDASGDQIVYVTGFSREQDGSIAGTGHAWNAARIGDGWVLLDATWDAGARGDNGRFVKKYGTEYLFTPPEIFAVTHFPDDPKWQLTNRRISRGEFTRQPMMQGSFYAEGLSFTHEMRSQVTVDSSLGMVLNNPAGRDLTVTYNKKSKPDAREKCDVRGSTQLTVSCDFPTKGEYEVILFTADTKYETHWSVGRVEVNASG